MNGPKFKRFWMIISVICIHAVASCSSSENGNEIQSNAGIEVPRIDLKDLWPLSSIDSTQICTGSILSFKESKNARVELRRINKDKNAICILGKSGNAWMNLGSSFLPYYSYRVVGEPYKNGYLNPDGSNAPWWDCNDKIETLFDLPNEEFGHIIVTFRRTWACHGDAGGTYQQNLLSLFINTKDPQTLVPIFPGLEILDFKKLTGLSYQTQQQFCAATGFCHAYSDAEGNSDYGDPSTISITRKDEQIYVLDPTGELKIPPNLELTLFVLRSLPCVISNMCDGVTHIEQ